MDFIFVTPRKMSSGRTWRRDAATLTLTSTLSTRTTTEKLSEMNVKQTMMDAIDQGQE